VSGCTFAQEEAVVEEVLPSTWQPWTWDGWNRFPSLYFAAEPEGYLSDEQLDKVSRFSLAIIEFRAGQWVEEESTGKWAGGDLAGFMEKQAIKISEHSELAPPVLVYRSGMWAGSMFERQWQALQNQDLFLKDKRDGEGFIEYPLDVDESGFSSPLDYCRWDFRKDETARVYKSLIEDAAKEQTSGIFFDNVFSVVGDEEKELSYMTFDERKDYMEKELVLLRESFQLLVDNNKYPILSMTGGFSDIGNMVPWEADVLYGEEYVIEKLKGVPYARNNEFWMWNLGQTASKQILNGIGETEMGIPMIVHMPYFPSDKGSLDGSIMLNGKRKAFTQDEYLEFGIAAFLVAMGEGSYFGFSDMEAEEEGGGWFDESWDYFDQYDKIITGKPVGKPRILKNDMLFVRQFENGYVWVNCENGTYEINMGEIVYTNL